MALSEIISVFSLITSVGTLIFVYKTYNRNRRFNNENDLFNAKLRAYQSISKALAVFTTKVEEMTLAGTERREFDDSYLKEFFERFVPILFEFKVVISEYIPLLPDSLKDKVQGFIDVTTNSDGWEDKISKNRTEAIEFYLDLLEKRSDAIFKSMSDDLNIEALHYGLFRRTKIKKPTYKQM